MAYESLVISGSFDIPSSHFSYSTIDMQIFKVDSPKMFSQSIKNNPLQRQHDHVQKNRMEFL